jgi:murein L,D-transpeptidase YafK
LARRGIVRQLIGFGISIAVIVLCVGAAHEVRQGGFPWEQAFSASFRQARIESGGMEATTSDAARALKEDQDSEPPPPAGSPVFIRIFKAESELELWLQGEKGWRLLDIYPVCRWSGELGPKLREGDGQTPEGFYRITKERLKPDSAYHLAMNIGYPNAYDRRLGRTGSFIMIHGACVSIGCFAMTDAGIEDIYGYSEKALAAGQKAIDVHIFPFRMTEENMRTHRASKWADFWSELKPAYESFERTRMPRPDAVF